MIVDHTQSAKAALNRQTFRLTGLLNSREHSKRIDKLLGFNIFRIESKLSKIFRHFALEEQVVGKLPYKENRESWIGLDPQVLLTPYDELARLFERLKDHDIQRIVDFGCAYGRVGIVSSFYYPEVEFIGYEFVSKRIKEAQRVFELQNMQNYQLIDCDILFEAFEIPTASLYFIYDFGRIADLKKILTKLIQTMQEQDFILVARGEEVRSLMMNFFGEFKKENMLREGSFLIYTHKTC